MCPLAKSAPQPVTQVPAQTTQQAQPVSNIVNIEGFEGIPFEVYRFFNITPSSTEANDIKQIKEVYKWSAKDSTGIGDIMSKMRNLEMKLGSPGVGETRYNKMYNYIRVSNIVDSLHREREQQIERINKKREAEARLIKKEHQKKLAAIEKKRKQETSAFKKSREAEEKQFKKLRDAYS